jgi:hypothetical protein
VSGRVGQRSGKLLGWLRFGSDIIAKRSEFQSDVRPLMPMFRRAFSKVDLPTFGIPITRTLSSIAWGCCFATSTNNRFSKYAELELEP